jgi:predicted nucleic acid-binding protein
MRVMLDTNVLVSAGLFPGKRMSGIALGIAHVTAWVTAWVTGRGR